MSPGGLECRGLRRARAGTRGAVDTGLRGSLGCLSRRVQEATAWRSPCPPCLGVGGDYKKPLGRVQAGACGHLATCAFALGARTGSPATDSGHSLAVGGLRRGPSPLHPHPPHHHLLPSSVTAGGAWPPRAQAALRPGRSTRTEPGRQQTPLGRQSQGKRGPSPEPREPVGSCGAFTPSPQECGLRSRTHRPDGRAEAK